MKKKSLLLFGNYGGQNWGDEAILSGLLSALPQDIFDITVVSRNPKKTKKDFGVHSVFFPAAGIRSFFRGLFHPTLLGGRQAIQKADIVVFGGGGLFQNREKKAIFLWSYYAFLCFFFHKKVVFVANSLGPLDGFLAQWLAKKVFLKAKSISVRDMASVFLLKELGIPKQKIVLATDAIFLARKKPAPKRKKGTLLALRGDGNFSVEKIKNTISSFPQPVSAIAMDEIDITFAKKLGVPLLHPQNISELFSVFAKVECIVSSRLHGNLLAIHNETPFLALSAAPKVQNFLEERGLIHLVFPEKITSLQLIKKAKEIFRQKTQWKKILSTVRKTEQKKAKEILPIFLQ